MNGTKKKKLKNYELTRTEQSNIAKTKNHSHSIFCTNTSSQPLLFAIGIANKSSGGKKIARVCNYIAFFSSIFHSNWPKCISFFFISILRNKVLLQKKNKKNSKSFKSITVCKFIFFMADVFPFRVVMIWQCLK
jgi:hypothetical protein